MRRSATRDMGRSEGARAMHHRIIRFVSTDSGRIALVALSIILVLLGGLGLCKAVLDEMLRKNAEATSSSWVETMVARNPEILKLPSGVPLSDRTRQVLDDASQFGDIYRFRIWDKAGRLIYKSKRIPSGDTRRPRFKRWDQAYPLCLQGRGERWSRGRFRHCKYSRVNRLVQFNLLYRDG
jgi:hypothetical protein